MKSFLEIIYESIVEMGLFAGEEMNAARRILAEIRWRHKGECLTIPKNSMREVDIENRNAAIRRDFDGTYASRDRVMKAYGISRATFYRIIRTRNEQVPAEN